MDTLLTQKHLYLPFKVIQIGVAVFLFLFLLSSCLSQGIFAKDILTLPTFKMQISVTEFLDPTAQISQFNTRVEEKFRGQKITNVSDGIKHVKYTKYFDKRPVKLNVVVFNQAIAKDYEIRPVIASTTLSRSNI